MKRISLAAASALAIGLAGCGDYDSGNNAYGDANAADYESSAADNAAYGTAGNATGNWPAGSRIVVENGVTYRVDADGTRVTLGPADSRIIVEDNVRFRVDPDGTRVRIDDEGAVIDIDDGDLDATVGVGDNTSVSVNAE